MLGICEYFRSEEANDMIRDDLNRFVSEVGVIDSEVSVEPLDLMCNELPRDEPLVRKDLVRSLGYCMSETRTFAATFSWTFARCSSLPLKTGVV
jgi:hypothetical protein